MLKIKGFFGIFEKIGINQEWVFREFGGKHMLLFCSHVGFRITKSYMRNSHHDQH
jgi:hypothetical protein